MGGDIREQLFALADPAYQKFNASLLPNVEHILGVRMPVLKKLARQIAAGDWRDYLDTAQNHYYEETMLQGLVIGAARADVEETLCRTADFIPKIGSWGVCDSFCAALKPAVRQSKERVWEFLQPWFASGREYELRFGIVMLLDYYIEPAYIGRVLSLLDDVRHEGYYVKMAAAWALSICYIKLPDATMPYLLNNSLDGFTYQTALRKITESRRIDAQTKEAIRRMRRAARA